jgi:hypothetical protein
MQDPKAGDRVELVHCSDPYTRLQPGEQGTVQLVDSVGTVHVKWDSGSSLGLVPNIDRWDLLKPRLLRFELEVEVPAGDQRPNKEIRDALFGALEVGSDHESLAGLEMVVLGAGS